MSSDKQHTVFMTGATGLVGSYLARLLVKKGYYVRALARKGADLSLLSEAREKVDLLEGSVGDLDVIEAGLKGAGVVVHAAGKVTFDPRKNKELTAVNQIATRTMVNAALDAGTEHFLHVSSIAAIGRSLDMGVITENTPWQDNPMNSIYARSKFAAEREVWRAHAEGLQMSLVNPGLVMGAGYWERSSLKLLMRVYKGLPFLPSGSAAFVDVRDLAHVMLGIIEHGPTNERLITAPYNLRWSDVIPRIAELMGRRAPTRDLPAVLEKVAPYLLSLQARVTGTEQDVTRESLRISKVDFQFRSINEHLLHGFQYLPFEESLRDAVEAFMATYPKGGKFAVLDF